MVNLFSMYVCCKVVFTGAGDRAFCAGGNLQPDESGDNQGMRQAYTKPWGVDV